MEKHVSKYVVITRPLAQAGTLQKELEEMGLSVFLYPGITIHKNIVTEETKKHLRHLDAFDWILFTSRNGVRFFIEALTELAINTSILQTKYIAAVGPKTAEEIRKYDVPVHFIPSAFTTDELAQQLHSIKGKKVLLPRANIAAPTLIEQLEKKGAIVTNVPMYNTEFTDRSDTAFEELLENKKILCLTFTSPSTVKGFLKNIENIQMHDSVFSLPVFSIGPVTTSILRHQGFQRIFTADIFTIEGMLAKLKENIL